MTNNECYDRCKGKDKKRSSDHVKRKVSGEGVGVELRLVVRITVGISVRLRVTVILGPTLPEVSFALATPSVQWTRGQRKKPATIISHTHLITTIATLHGHRLFDTTIRVCEGICSLT